MISKIVYFAKRRWWLLLIIIAALVFGAFKMFGPKAETKITSYTVKRGTLKETLSLSGEINAYEKATLRFQTSGYLNWVGVKEGDKVNKFQVLASLDQSELQKNLRKYLNTYMNERWDFESTKNSSGDASVMTTAVRRVFEQAQFDLNNAVLDVELRDIAVKYANLWTPIDGIVTRVAAPNAGVNVTPTQAEIDVVNPDSLYFSATADQTEVAKLTASHSAEITLDAFDKEKITGTVSTISYTPKAGETGTVYEVKIDFLLTPNPYSLRLGMTGDAEFIVKELPDVLYVPSKLVKTENSKKYVLKQNKEKVFVTIGEEMDGEVEIKDGLKENDIIY
jgi:RND family efflux transporter MFP subunit